MTQSSKTLVTIAVLLVFGGGLGLFAYLRVYEKDESDAQKKAHDARLFSVLKPGERPGDEQPGDAGIARADFVKVTVTSQGETTVLEREVGESWRITAPVLAKADAIAADALVSHLQTAKFKATIEENPDQTALEKYGLATPTLIVEAVAQVSPNNDKRTVRLEGGIENTFDGSLYMRRNGEKPVYSAEGGTRYALAKTTFDLRDKQLFALDEPTLQKAVVRAKANAWTLERNAEGHWALIAPMAELADASQISGMFMAMNGERAQKFFDNTAENRRKFGLDTPMLDATFTTSDGKSFRFRVAKVESPEAFYGLREEEKGSILAEVTASASTQLDRNPIDLQDKTLLRFKKEAVTQIRFRASEGREIVAAKDSVDASAEAWRVVAPREGKAKIFKITSVLWSLSSLKASTIHSPKPKELEALGLGSKAKTVVLSGADGAQLATLAIGTEVPGKPKTFYVRGSRGVVSEADGARFDDFPEKVSDLLMDAPDAGDGGDAGLATPSPSPSP